MKFTSFSSRAAGFSMIELLGVVSVVGILAAAGFAVTSKVRQAAEQEKLRSEVSALNSAVSSYMAFGGNLDDADSPGKVLSKLRTVVASDLASRIPGLSSSMIDPTMDLKMQSEAEAATNAPRAYWDPTKKKFELATSGDAGIAAFFLNEALANSAKTLDSREFTQLYAAEDTWVWDYKDNPAQGFVGPTTISTGTPTDTTPPIVPPTTNPGPTASPLASPVFSIPTGTYSIRDYDLEVTLSNPNPTGTSDIYFQIDYGNWSRYTPNSVLTVGPDQIVAAQAIASSSSWSDSSRVLENYGVQSEQLNPPAILTSASTFGALQDRLIGVVLEDTNGDDPGRMQYRINQGPWIDYDGFLLMDRVDFQGGAMIEGRTLAEGNFFETSSIASAFISVTPISLDGESLGTFHNPTGDSRMVTNLGAAGSSSNYFEWGKITNGNENANNGFSKSSLEFTGTQSAGFGFGEQFYLGNLDYHNGTVLLGTSATNVDFNLNLDLSIAGNALDTMFDFEFYTVTTANTDDEWESADYVGIDQSSSTSTFTFEGLELELVLNFGETSEEGFSTFDTFHVLEDETAASDIYATVFDRTKSRGNVGSQGQAKPDFDSSDNSAWDRLLEWVGSLTGGDAS